MRTGVVVGLALVCLTSAQARAGTTLGSVTIGAQEYAAQPMSAPMPTTVPLVPGSKVYQGRPLADGSDCEPMPSMQVVPTEKTVGGSMHVTVDSNLRSTGVNDATSPCSVFVATDRELKAMRAAHGLTGAQPEATAAPNALAPALPTGSAGLQGNGSVTQEQMRWWLDQNVKKHRQRRALGLPSVPAPTPTPGLTSGVNGLGTTFAEVVPHCQAYRLLQDTLYSDWDGTERAWAKAEIAYQTTGADGPRPGAMWTWGWDTLVYANPEWTWYTWQYTVEDGIGWTQSNMGCWQRFAKWAFDAWYWPQEVWVYFTVYPYSQPLSYNYGNAGEYPWGWWWNTHGVRWMPC